MIEEHTGKLAIAGLLLIAGVIATLFWPWLGYVDAALAGTLAWPVCRWYAELFRGLLK